MKINLRAIKRQWLKGGMRQLIDSPHKTFNKQTNLIDNSGNLIASTQNATYIRAYNETKCNGFTFKKGHLQEHDTTYLHNRVKERIKASDKTHSFWVTNFFIKDTFCTFLVDLSSMELTTFDFSTNYKQRQLVKWLQNYLFEKVGE